MNKPNALKKYLKDNDMTLDRFSHLMGFSIASISGWANGKTRPSKEAAIKLFKKTRGKIPLETWDYQMEES